VGEPHAKRFARPYVVVVDRKTGVLLQESIPTYLRVIFRMANRSRLGRFLQRKGSFHRFFQRLTVRRGERYNSSASAREILPFVRLYSIDLSEVEREAHEYATFNEFFFRRLRPGARPVPPDPTVLLSPADCRMVVFETVVDATQLWIKGKNFTIENLLGPQWAAVHAARFLGGSLCIARLAPQDYHRWHCPVSGLLGPRQMIDGAYFTVNPMAVNRDVDVLTENKRELYEIQSDIFGTVLMVAVGACMVASINCTAPHRGSPPYERIERGAEHGYFAFGGSTLIVLFEPGVVLFDPDLVHNSRRQIETMLKCNSRIGVRRPSAAAAPVGGVAAAAAAAAPSAAAAAPAAAPSE
jgi:phosphatidylserine decarboxylase